LDKHDIMSGLRVLVFGMARSGIAAVSLLRMRGAYVIASNSDPKNVNEDDNFFDKLYSRHKIFRIGASRAINSVGKSRGKISELLIASY